ncbi:MAG: hypothetical protein COV76_07100 [Candidatus Omnitrophica bacterium CG11_big_fil_rev_8_21_14_0_20_64_10]|nr:MAG: hypothetical protein COV76_07100 [Candidatus Omnitrophica bacterium CG11_big_fil_rev_8_21_14_0_20_64_10]
MKVERSKNPALFFSNAERARIVQAIREAEKRTSGEIRVHLERKAREPFYDHAKEIFEKVGMTRTRERNGVLIFIGLASRRFALLGDRGISEKVPADFWGAIVSAMEADFKEDRFADGIVRAVVSAGEKLGACFPCRRDDINELPDEISFSF